MSSPGTRALSQFNPPTRAAFDAIRKAIASDGSSLRTRSGVIDVRPGYRFKDGWITEEPAIVVVVRRKLRLDQVPVGERIPLEIQGVPIDVTSAAPVEQLRAESTTRDLDQLLISQEYLPALPGWEFDEESETRSWEYASRGASQPYIPPPGLRLDAVEGPMTVTCHAGPDAGWTTLAPFLAKLRHRLTVGMYDFSAPHILKRLREAAVAADGKLRMVLDPGLTLNRGRDPNSPKALDVTEEQIRDELQEALGDRFEMVWASVKRVGKTTGGIFASAYHIKVAVRDGEAFWLSSGNWQSSNQPDPERLGADVDPGDLLRNYNREWHVIVEHPGLSRLYEQYLEYDLSQATPLQRGLVGEMASLPDVFVPIEQIHTEQDLAIWAMKGLAAPAELHLDLSRRGALRAFWNGQAWIG